MNINATILVQIINFFITQFLLRRLFIRPVAYVIHQQESEANAIQQRIDHAHALLVTHQQEREKSWQVFHDHCATILSEQPQFKREPCVYSIKPVPVLHEEEVSMLAHDISVELLERIR